MDMVGSGGGPKLSGRPAAWPTFHAVLGGMSEGARLLAIDKEAWASGGTAWLPEMARQDASAPIARPARCPSTTATSMSRGW